MDKNIDITFIVLLYNQEACIVEHLDSLVVALSNRVMEEYNVELVIADDCSSDRSLCLVKTWLEKNRVRFSRVVIASGKDNLGTCKNLCRALRASSGRYVKILAADDLYLSCGISSAIDLLDNCDIVLSPVVSEPKGHSNEEIEIDQKSIYLLNEFSTNSLDKLKKRFEPPISTPGWFFRRSVFSDEVLTFLEKFDLVEDKALWLKLLNDNKFLSINFLNQPMVCYRRHDNSVSNQKRSPVFFRYRCDRKKLFFYQIRNCPSYIYKLIHMFGLVSIYMPTPLSKYIVLSNHLKRMRYLIWKIGNRVKY